MKRDGVIEAYYDFSDARKILQRCETNTGAFEKLYPVQIAKLKHYFLNEIKQLHTLLMPLCISYFAIVFKESVSSILTSQNFNISREESEQLV